MGLETIAAALTGDIAIHNHCYRAAEMAIVIDMAKEFGYRVAAFHHAVDSYKIADLPRDHGICSATWEDRWGFTVESKDDHWDNECMVEMSGDGALGHSDDEQGPQRAQSAEV